MSFTLGFAFPFPPPRSLPALTKRVQNKPRRVRACVRVCVLVRVLVLVPVLVVVRVLVLVLVRVLVPVPVLRSTTGGAKASETKGQQRVLDALLLKYGVTVHAVWR